MREARAPSAAGDGIVQSRERLVMIVGNYGSGKTEVAVNLALHLVRAGRRVHIADLDIVNPYFRCREARVLMERHGIRVVVPPGVQAWADLPIVLPEIRGLLHPQDGTTVIFDVGGDDAGARVLASMRTSLEEGEYELWQVINAKRPFTSTLEGCLAMRRAIELASRLSVTGLLVNSHLIEQTDADTVLEGWRLAEEMSRFTALPVRAVAVMAHLAGAPALRAIEAPLLRLERHMAPPWVFSGEGHGPNRH